TRSRGARGRRGGRRRGRRPALRVLETLLELPHLLLQLAQRLAHLRELRVLRRRGNGRRGERHGATHIAKHACTPFRMIAMRAVRSGARLERFREVREALARGTAVLRRRAAWRRKLGKRGDRP